MKILHKLLILLGFLTVGYIAVVTVFTIPKINDTIYALEERNGKEILNKMVTLASNVTKDLEAFKKRELENHKEKLKDLTSVAYSIINAKYQQSKSKNISTVLKQRAKELKTMLLDTYNKNKNSMSEKDLKTKIIEFAKEYRHSDGVGYFWINDMKPNMIMHPIVTELNDKYIGDYADPNGVKLFSEMVKLCKKNGSGTVKYQWLNPKTRVVEDKISFVFTFEPYDWVIGTGEYYSVLNEKLKNDVKELVRELRYGDDNYFFIVDYSLKILSNSNIKDGNLFVTDLLKTTKNKGEGFITYKRDAHEKLTFAKDFKNWEFLIATGINIEKIEQHVKIRKQRLFTQFENMAKKTIIGKTGYIYAFSKDGKMIIHPNSYIKKIDFRTLKNPTTSNSLFDDLVRASKTTKELRYKWNRPDDKKNYIYDKISWIEYIPSLEIYVASSAYEDDFKDTAYGLMDKMLIISLIAAVISFFISLIVLKKILNPLTLLSNLTHKVAKGDYSAVAKETSSDEIGYLAKDFNKMTETIKNQIDNLDEKIKQKTFKLEESKEEIMSINSSLKQRVKEEVEKNRAKEQKLIEQNKLAQMGEMLSMIAHQWRQPLTAISATSSAIELKAKLNKLDSKTATELSQNINKYTQHLSKTIDDFRNFFKKKKRKEIATLESIVEGTLLIAKPAIENKNIKITTTFACNKEIESHPSEIKQVVLNLIQNATDALLETNPTNPTIDITTTCKEDKKILTIKDNGGGIPKKIIDKIFEPYFSTKFEKDGTGLGLYMSKTIIEKHCGGELHVTNDKDGAVFTIEI